MDVRKMREAHFSHIFDAAKPHEEEQR